MRQAAIAPGFSKTNRNSIHLVKGTRIAAEAVCDLEQREFRACIALGRAASLQRSGGYDRVCGCGRGGAGGLAGTRAACAFEVAVERIRLASVSGSGDGLRSKAMVLTARSDSASSRWHDEIARTLSAAGFQAYFAGGCVRDLLLGQAPKDFDVATSARPDADLAACLRRPSR